VLTANQRPGNEPGALLCTAAISSAALIDTPRAGGPFLAALTAMGRAVSKIFGADELNSSRLER
jgi:hypothetical protein